MRIIESTNIMSVFIDNRERWEQYRNPIAMIGASGCVSFEKGLHLTMPRDDRTMICLEPGGRDRTANDPPEWSRVPALKKLAFRALVTMAIDGEALQQDFCDLARLGMPPCYSDEVPEVKIYPRQYKAEDDVALRMTQVQYFEFEKIPMNDNVLFVRYMQARYREALYNILMEWTQRAYHDNTQLQHARAACVPVYQPYVQSWAQEFENYTSVTITCVVKKLFATQLEPRLVADWPISCPFVLE